MKYFDRFVNILKWVSAVSITISVVVSVAVMAGYMGWGYEPMAIINFAIAFSIASILVCIAYFALCIVAYIRVWWLEKHEKTVYL